MSSQRTMEVLSYGFSKPEDMLAMDAAEAVLLDAGIIGEPADAAAAYD